MLAATDILLSVVIPVYRVEQLMDRCVESVLAQDVERMEVVLVDDGSPDGCPEKCDHWAGKDNRIRVVHKTNGGLSDARNAGINLARGTFITFADSDDFVEPGTYAAVLKEMEGGADIVEYPVYKFYGSAKQEKEVFEPTVYTNMRAYWIEGRAYAHAYAWNKIYRRQLFKGVAFPKGKLFEDAYTLPLLLKRAKKVVQTNKGLYFYCANNEGITATAGANGLRQLVKAHLQTGWVYEDEQYYMHVVNIQLSVSMITGEAPLLKTKRIRNMNHLKGTTKAKALVLNLIGIRGLCRLFHVLASMHLI